jgi:parallel beta-helix repeat protein
MKSLLVLVSELFSSANSTNRHRVVIDKVERVRNEPLSLSFKRHLKTLSSQDVVQRLYLPAPVEASVVLRRQQQQQEQQKQLPQLQKSEQLQQSPQQDINPVEEEQILSVGFSSCLTSGPFGSGLYFPCSVTVFKVFLYQIFTFVFHCVPFLFQASAIFRVFVCDVAVGNTLIYDEKAAVVPNLQETAFDSVSYSPGLVSRNNAAVSEDFAVKSVLQAVPRFVVTFTLHSTDSARNIRVVSADGSGDHRSLRDALDLASAGDLILLRPGTYSEVVTMSKDVHVMASLGGVAVIDSTVTITSNCQLSGVTVRPPDGSALCIAVSGGSPTLTQCDIAGMVSVSNAAQLVLRDCRIHDSARHGVHVAEKSTCLVERCRLDSIEMCGVQVDGGARGVIMNSSVSYCKQNGIYLVDGAKGVIEGCNIFGCSFPGIAVNAADPVITRNRVHHNERSGLVIAGRSDDNTLVEDNNIFSNGRDGVMIAKDAVCLLQGNSIFDNKGAGIQIMSGANPQLVKTHVYSNKESGIVIAKGGNAHISGFVCFYLFVWYTCS